MRSRADASFKPCSQRDQRTYGSRWRSASSHGGAFLRARTHQQPRTSAVEDGEVTLRVPRRRAVHPPLEGGVEESIQSQPAPHGGLRACKRENIASGCLNVRLRARSPFRRRRRLECCRASWRGSRLSMGRTRAHAGGKGWRMATQQRSPFALSPAVIQAVCRRRALTVQLVRGRAVASAGKAPKQRANKLSSSCKLPFLSGGRLARNRSVCEGEAIRLARVGRAWVRRAPVALSPKLSPARWAQ